MDTPPPPAAADDDEMPREQQHAREDAPRGFVPPMRPVDVAAVEALLGYEFGDKSLVGEALTHGSFYYPYRPGADTYERLEYLGDGVLTCLVSREVFLTYRDLPPGPLTRLRAANVDKEKLARVAVEHGLHRFHRHKAPQLDGQGALMANGFYSDLLTGNVGLDGINWGESHDLHLGGDEQATPPMRPNLKRSNNFIVNEDNVLVDGWLEISQDAATRNEQSRSSYWKRIYDYFHANKKEESDRSQNSLQHRWAAIQEQVNRLCGAYAQILSRNQSGMTQQDKLTQACIKYQADDKLKKPFVLMHCYEKLHHTEKWASRLPHKKQKRTSNASPGSSTTGTNASVYEDEAVSPSEDVPPRTRPIGKKAAKELLRRGKGSTSTGDSTVIEFMGGMWSAKRDETTTREAKKQERFDQATALEQQRVAIEQEKVDLKRIMEEQKIMTIDISGMDEQQQQYYKILRSQILARESNRSG